MLPNHYFLAFRWIWTKQLGLPATPVNSLALQAAIHAHDITLSSPRLTDDVICSVLFCCHHSQINLGFIYLRFLFPELCRLFSPAKSNLLFLFLSGHGVCPTIFGHADWCRDSKTNFLISWWLSYTNLDLGAPKFLFCFCFFKFCWLVYFGFSAQSCILSLTSKSLWTSSISVKMQDQLLESTWKIFFSA